MKKVSKVLSTVIPSFFILGMAVAVIPALMHQNAEAGEDTAIYTKGDDHVDFNHPDIRNYAEDDDEDEDVTVEVDKVILHYYNEGGGNKGDNGRAFYLWVTGVDGKEYNTSSYKPDIHNPGGIVTVSDDDTMMTIEIDFSTDEFKEFANRSGLYFIIKYAMKSDTDLNWGGQSDDMFIRYADYPQAVNTDKVCELWTMQAAGGGIAILDSEAKTKVHGVALAQFTDWKTIHCTLTSDTVSVTWKLYAYDQTYYKIKPKKRPENQKWYLVKEGTGTGDFDIQLKYEAHINMVYSLESHDPSSDKDPDMASLSKVVTVGYDWLYNSDKFHTYYEDANKNKAFGVTYGKEETTFRVWSPVAANMNLLIYDKDTSSEYCGSTDEDVKKAYDKYQGYHMQYKSGGVWEITITGADLEGKYYNYQVENTVGTNVVMDPYATSAGANGIRGLIYDKNGSKVTPEGWDNLPTKWDGETEKGLDIASPQELSIYEVHIQDFTGDSSWISNKGNARGTYNAFVEAGTRLEGESGDQFWKTTGYDHLNGLGVKAVQIMPTFDHDNNEVAEKPKYNWGYNPLNYNIPEGAYSSDPHDGFARVKEFKNMVLELSKTEAHTRTIMDVVYNHVSSATGSNFHKLMPRYYFRYALKDYTYHWGEHGEYSSTVKQGELWDGSGCHNEVASERPMMRKFIIDSLCMWARDYKIKGFRFDLMGLIDFKTMNEARKALYEIDPDIYLYGEGWTSDGYHGEGSAEYNEYYGKHFDNYGAFTWQVYNECNKYKAGDGVFLGGFNDTYRDSMRGNNDPGTGWIQGGNWVNSSNFRYDLVNNITAGVWGMNYGVYGNGQEGNGDHTGRFPEQTVNYISCHDNWTVADQFFQTLLSRSDDPSSYAYVNPNEVTSSILRASIQAHAVTMASNSAAFILGGEEFLRTKTIPEDLHDQITDATSYKEFYGNWVSHNSYNSPLAVNTFKWGNKKEVTFSGTKGSDDFSQTITNAEYNYCDAFASIIKMHSKLNFKHGENIGRVEDFMGDISWRWWSRNGQTDLSNCIAIRTNDVLIFAAVGPIDMNSSTEYLGCKKADIGDLYFNYGYSEWDGDHLFPKNYNFIQVSKDLGY